MASEIQAAVIMRELDNYGVVWKPRGRELKRNLNRKKTWERDKHVYLIELQSEESISENKNCLPYIL